MANKNTSEPDSNRRPRSRAVAKPAPPRRPATPASSKMQSSSDGAAQIDSAADMSASSNVADPAYDEIAEAAYHRFLRRGGRDGSDLDDWVEAERELRSRRTR